MPRLDPVRLSDASPAARKILEPIHTKRGRVPNIYATFAHSSAALEYLLAGGRAMGRFSLDARLREAVTLAIATVNDCEYCACAHAALAGGLGVDEQEIQRNLRGESAEARTQAAIDFARALLTREGYITDDDLAAVRDAGFSEGEIVELIVLVAHNLLTNYFNHVAQTDIDFPRIEIPQGVGA